MNDEQIQAIIKDMQEFFSTELPDPVQEPIRFAYYVKLYKYYKFNR